MMSAQEILLRVKKNVLTQKSAEHLSKMRGDGLDFCEIRAYQFGDDVRHINFSASGKTGELQTNIFNEDKQINVVICVLLSSSLHFGSVRLKNELVAEIIGYLGYSSIQQKNQTKLVFFLNNEQQILQLNSMGDLLSAIEKMLDFDLLEIQSNSKMLNNYIVQQKKSLVFMVGDFYQQDDYSTIAHKNQVNAILVRDPLEEFPYFGAELDLVDTKNHSVLKANINKRLAKKYQDALQKEDNKRYAHFAKHDINVGKIYTNDVVFDKLSQILR